MGLLMGILYLYISRSNILKILDIATPLLPLGLFIGRIGCFLKGCCFGTICNINFTCIRFPKGSDAYNHQLDRGMVSQYDSYSLPVFPVQLFESFINGILFLYFWLKYKKKKVDGQITFGVLFSHSFVRFFLDFLRANIDKIYGFTISQFVAGVIIFLLFLIRRRSSN